MLSGSTFTIAQAKLEPGDTLMAFTDGVTDARNPQGKLFHESSLLPLLQEPAESATALLDRVDLALKEHIADAVQFDDITMLAARRLPKG
jgi:sigma-B regulation protein RsbU (phosphoserine phosphatase)